MPAAWETWTLLWLAALQFAVAYWWWRGPYLEGTRGWVAALFFLNGAATLLNLLGDIGGLMLADALGSVADKGTNLALLAVGLIALDVHDRWRRVRRVVLWVLGVYTVVALVAWFPTRLAGTAQPVWTKPATAHLLLVAILVGAIAILQRARRWEEGTNALWTLALAGLGLRYAELATWLYLPLSLSGFEGSPLAVIHRLLKAAGFWVTVAAFAGLLWRYERGRPRRDPRLYEISLLLILAGFLFGAARSIRSDVTFLGLVFTLAFVRPLVFLEVQSRLAGGRLWEQYRRPLVRGFGGFAGAALGTLFAAGIGMAGLGSFLTGAAVAPVGVWVAGTLWPPDGAGGEPARRRLEPAQDVNWPLDEEGVPLPDDWRARTQDAYEKFRALPDDVQEALADLSYWERIVLALDGAPETEGAPAYQRTTPGLHFRTHCPYSNVGPEIKRANDRWRTILDEHGIGGPDAPPEGEPLVEGDWGRAQELDSPRVKFYHLTPLGEEVAQSLRAELGLEGADPADVAEVVGEGFTR